MTAYRFRVKFEYDPRSLWRDIVVGADRTLDEFQTVLNGAVGLDHGHLWFFGTDQDYWDSNVQYKRPGEIEQSPGGLLRGGKEYDAGETSIGQMARQLDLDERDRICYLFDYGDEWRFYGILKEIDEDAPGDREPTVVKRKGEPVEQYAPRGDRL
ncbi:MAG: IS1096 element passenger TnpR family protein [Natronomonas sp.]